jgi:exonuclease III
MASSLQNTYDATVNRSLHELDLSNHFDLTSSSSPYIDMDEINEVANKNDKYTSLHINIQGLPSKFDILNSTLNDLSSKDIQVDFIMICESFLTDVNQNLFNIPGYSLVTKNRMTKRRGGIALYVKNGYNFKLRNDIGVNVEGVFESLFIEIKTKQNTKLIVGEIYRVPGTNETNSLHYFDQTLNTLAPFNEIIIGTDQNFDYLKIDSHKSSNELLQLFISNGLIPTITKPTRITHSSATLIDNIYVSSKLNEHSKAAILRIDLSDHLPVLTCVEGNKNNEHKQPLTFKHRTLNDNQVAAINNELNLTNWDFTLNAEADEAYNKFINRVMEVIDTHAPEKICNIPRSKVREMPWFTSGLQKSSKTLHKLYKKAIGKTKVHSDHIKYRTYRNAYNKAKRSAK